MSGRCLQCQLYCAAAKILCYQFCCCCFHEKKIPKKDMYFLMLGLQNAGKSHLLAELCHEPLSDIKPTDGFSMKDIILETLVLHIKELGGSPKILPYWNHYMGGSEGVIYVVDGKTLENKDKCDKNCTVLRTVLENVELENVPLLVLITKLDTDECESVDEYVAILDLPEICGHRKFIVDFVHDIDKTKATLERFAQLLNGENTAE